MIQNFIAAAKSPATTARMSSEKTIVTTTSSAAASTAALPRMPLSDSKIKKKARSDSAPILRLSAVVPISSGAAVATNGPDHGTSSTRVGRSRSPKGNGAVYREIHSPRGRLSANAVALPVQDDTMEKSLTMGLSALLSGIMEAPSVNVGIAEGRAQVQQEAEAYRDQLHLRYRSEFEQLAEHSQQRAVNQEVSAESYVQQLTQQFQARSVTLETEADAHFISLQQQLSEQVLAATSFKEAESVVHTEAVRMQTELATFAEQQLHQSHFNFLSENAMIKQNYDIAIGEHRDEISYLVEQVQDLQRGIVAEQNVVAEQFSTVEFAVSQREAGEYHLYEQYLDLHNDLKNLQTKESAQKVPEQVDADIRYDLLKEEYMVIQNTIEHESSQMHSDRERMEAWAAHLLEDTTAQCEMGLEWEQRCHDIADMEATCYSHEIRAEQVAENAEAAALYSDSLYDHLGGRFEIVVQELNDENMEAQIAAKASTNVRQVTILPTTERKTLPQVGQPTALITPTAPVSYVVPEPMKIPSTTLRLPGLTHGPGMSLFPVTPKLVSPPVKAVPERVLRDNNLMAPDVSEPAYVEVGANDVSGSDDPFVSALSHAAKTKTKKKQHSPRSSGSSSSDDRTNRRRAHVKPLELVDPPAAGSLRSWMGDFYVRLCASSKRSQKRTIAWAKQIMVAKDPEALAQTTGRWEDLDSVLSLAVLQIARGPVRRDILKFQELNLHKGEPLGGRQALFIMLKRYNIDSGTQMQLDLSKINTLKYDGDLEIFLDKLDYVLLDVNTSIPEEFLYAVIEPELRKCNELAPNFVALDATRDGDPLRTSHSLYEIARDCLDRKMRMDRRKALIENPDDKKALVIKREDKGGKGKGRGGKSNTPCAQFLAGNCRYGDKCIFQHSASPSKAPPTSPAPVATPETRKTPCRSYVQSGGKCKFGAECIFKHDKNTLKGDGKGKPGGGKGKAKREPGSAKHKDGTPVICEAFKTGSCTYGDKCVFQHDAPSADKPQPFVLISLAAKRSTGLTERYTIDTGTGRDIAGEELEGEAVDDEYGAIPSIATGGGVVDAVGIKRVWIPQLGEYSDHLVLKDSPPALTVGRRCAKYGYEFHWKPYADKPCFRLPDGSDIAVDVDEDDVPLLASIADSPVVPSTSRLIRALPATAPPMFSTEKADMFDDGGDDPCEVFGNISDIAEETPTRNVDEPCAHDLEIDADVAPPFKLETFLDTKVDDNKELDKAQFQQQELDHLLTHLGKCGGCEACRFAKTYKSPSRRRENSGVTCTAPDMITKPFGAMLHADHMVMKHGSTASLSSKNALIFFDEATGFAGAFPGHSRDTDSEISAFHSFEGADQLVRRLRTDNAGELVAAGVRLRSLRPLAHYLSIPNRPQSNSVAERFMRVVVEGARSLLFQSGLTQAWWPFAVMYFVTCRNAWIILASGFTPWYLRHGSDPGFEKYPFGALVLTRCVKKVGGTSLEKFDGRLQPFLLLNVDLNPGCSWSKTYTVVSLEKLISRHRSGYVPVRRVCDLVFPENITFPLRQRLALNGAMLDSACPAPSLSTTEQGGFAPKQDVGDEEQDITEDNFDGIQNENSERLVSDLAELAMALEPDFHPADEALAPEAGADREVQEIDDGAHQLLALQVSEDTELRAEGREPPTGWRLDVFPCGMTCSTPPYSLRPPHVRSTEWTDE